MNVQIRIGITAILVYTAALLGAAVGLSYLVFEWADDGPRGNETTIESLDERLGALADDLENRLGRCQTEVSRLTRLLTQSLTGAISDSGLPRELRVLGGQLLVCGATAQAPD